MPKRARPKLMRTDEISKANSPPSVCSSSAGMIFSTSAAGAASVGGKRKRLGRRGVVRGGGGLGAGSGTDGSGGSDSASTAPREVVFFGDSLTYGMSHDRADRYAVPWPRLLAGKLKKHDLDVVECAMCSRTTRFDDINLDNSDWLPHAKPQYFNGQKALIPQLLSHSPQWLVLLLGTNDLQRGIQDQYDEKRNERGYGYSGGRSRTTLYDRAEEIAESCAALANEACLFFEDLKVVIVTPPPVRLTEDCEDWGFNEESVEISKKFPDAFRRVCRRYGFLNANPPAGKSKGQIDMRDSEDGVHITEAHNCVVAKAVWEAMGLENADDTRPLRRRKPTTPYL